MDGIIPFVFLAALVVSFFLPVWAMRFAARRSRARHGRRATRVAVAVGAVVGLGLAVVAISGG